MPAGAWSLPSTFAGTRVHHGYRRAVVVDAGRRILEVFGFVVDAFTPVHDAWLSWIDPGGFIVPHRDAGPWRERWQVPIRTAGWLEQGDTQIDATDGEPFRVTHWEPHSVWNPTDNPRVHLVLDRDVIARAGSAPFVKEF